MTLRDLLGRSESDTGVQSTKEMMGKKGWAADILDKQKPDRRWEETGSLYQPKYTSTNWMLLVLADLGLTRREPRIAKACELWLERFAKKDGGFGAEGWNKGHLCTTGNTARALVQFGYANHEGAKRFRMVSHKPSQQGRMVLFRIWQEPRFVGSPHRIRRISKGEMDEKHEKFGREGRYLERELHKQGPRYRPWYRFHYPVHYYYDLLVGLDFMTALGYRDDRRLRYSLSLLRKKRRQDGKWIGDAVHPDVEGPMAEWYMRNPKRRPIPFTLEKPGEPSKIVTLRAMRVLDRLDHA